VLVTDLALGDDLCHDLGLGLTLLPIPLIGRLGTTMEAQTFENPFQNSFPFEIETRFRKGGLAVSPIKGANVFP